MTHLCAHLLFLFLSLPMIPQYTPQHYRRRAVDGFFTPLREKRRTFPPTNTYAMLSIRIMHMYGYIIEYIPRHIPHCLPPSFHPGLSLEESNLSTPKTGHRHQTTITNFVVKQKVVILSFWSLSWSLQAASFKFPALEVHWTSCHHSSPSALPRKERRSAPTRNPKLTDKLGALLGHWSCFFVVGILPAMTATRFLPRSSIAIIALTHFKFGFCAHSLPSSIPHR